MSATKPAHTPSAGAMRAIAALCPTDWKKSETDPILRSSLENGALVIDRETAHAELVAAMEWAVKYADAEYEPRSILKHIQENFRAALAKAQS